MATTPPVAKLPSAADSLGFTDGLGNPLLTQGTEEEVRKRLTTAQGNAVGGGLSPAVLALLGSERASQ